MPTAPNAFAMPHGLDNSVVRACATGYGERRTTAPCRNDGGAEERATRDATARGARRATVHARCCERHAQRPAPAFLHILEIGNGVI